jgi:pyruvate formate lyase activating enzyme
MIFGGLQKLTLIDFPGKLACTIFCAGCNFRCHFCYNRELVLAEEIKRHPKISEDDFFEFLSEKRKLLEGVCVTGGEPTLQKDLPDFIKKIKKLGFLVKLDTNGSNPGMLEKLFREKLIDYIAMDIKAPLGVKSKISNLKSKKYEKVVGAKINLNKIKKSIELVKNSGVDYEFRTTVVPVLHTKEDIIQIAREISSAKKYFLQNFRPKKTVDPKLAKIKPYPQEFLLEIQKAISPFFEICQVR